MNSITKFIIAGAVVVLAYIFFIEPPKEISGLSYCHLGLAVGSEHCHWIWDVNHIH